MRRFWRLGVVTVVLLGVSIPGCAPEPVPQAARPAVPPPVAAESGSDGENAKPAETIAASAPQAPMPAAPSPKATFADDIARASDLFKNNDWDKALEVLTAAEKSADGKADVAAAAELRTKIEEARAAQMAARRQEQLAQAEKAFQAGDLEQATLALDEVLKDGPAEEERLKAERLRKLVEDHRRRKREMTIAMQLLASDKPTDVRGARSRLIADPDVALPLVAEAVSSKDPRLAENALGILRSFNDPVKTLPILVAVLSRGDQSRLWPVATRELQKLSVPGAGPQLLELLGKTQDPQQRSAVLLALASVVDPPVATLPSLLPATFQDSPDLPVVLQALRHAVTVNGQADLLTQRGFPEPLAPELESKLAELPARLEALAAVTPATETSQAALSLGIVTRLLAPKPIPDVKVLRASAEAPDSSARNCLDGAWTAVDVKTMWRHPSDKPVTLVLDLGVERTVSGIKIWNHNEAGGRHRGWKEVDVYVSNTPASLTPVAKGVLPMAPGTAEPPDYGSVLTVPCVRGRYVRLEARTYWQPDGIAGISELQVLGF